METEKRREIDGIENEREQKSEKTGERDGGKGGVCECVWVHMYVCICNTVHRTSRSRMEAEEREGGEG